MFETIRNWDVPLTSAFDLQNKLTHSHDLSVCSFTFLFYLSFI